MFLSHILQWWLITQKLSSQDNYQQPVNFKAYLRCKLWNQAHLVNHSLRIQDISTIFKTWFLQKENWQQEIIIPCITGLFIVVDFTKTFNLLLSCVLLKLRQKNKSIGRNSKLCIYKKASMLIDIVR